MIFILHSFNNYFLNIYYVLSTVLVSPGHTKIPSFLVSTFTVKQNLSFYVFQVLVHCINKMLRKKSIQLFKIRTYCPKKRYKFLKVVLLIVWYKIEKIDKVILGGTWINIFKYVFVSIWFRKHICIKYVFVPIWFRKYN